MLRLLAACAAIAALAACSSLAPAPSPATPPDPAALDYARTMVVIDLPSALQPIPVTTKLVYDGGNGAVTSASLVPSERDFDAEALPPPTGGHAYYLLSLDEAGAKAVAAAQTASGGAGKVTLDPQFCSTAPVDIASARLTVYLLEDGKTVIPFISASDFSRQISTQSATNLQFCAP